MRIDNQGGVGIVELSARKFRGVIISLLFRVTLQGPTVIFAGVASSHPSLLLSRTVESYSIITPCYMKGAWVHTGK